MSSLASVGLEQVLARGDVWRGDALARLEADTVPSGFPQLDAELPGGGWPRGALTEVLHDHPGIGELAFLLPVLARQSAAGGWLALVAPPWRPFAPAWAAAGVRLDRLVVVEAGEDAPWCCEQLLASGGFAAVLGWLGRQDDARQLRRLQVAAEGQRSLAFLWRRVGQAAVPSPAPLRLAVAPAAEGVELRILKRRGRPASQPCHLPLPRPGKHAHALVGSPLPAAAAGIPVLQAIA